MKYYEFNNQRFEYILKNIIGYRDDYFIPLDSDLSTLPNLIVYDSINSIYELTGEYVYV